MNACQVLKHYLTGRTSGNIDYYALTDELIKEGEKKKGVFSNSQIKISVWEIMALTKTLFQKKKY